MKASLAGLATFAALALSAHSASAQYAPNTYGYPPPPRYAPDMCWGGIYTYNGCQWYGPGYNVYPPFQPFQGILPGKQYPGLPCPPGCAPQNNGPGNVALPVNPWTRSPRDFFMWGEAQQERMTRENRPAFVP